MKKTIEEYYCDCCGKKLESGNIETIEGLFLDDDWHNIANNRIIEFQVYNNGYNIHLCPDCKNKLDMLKAYFINDVVNLFEANKELIRINSR